ncbi:hypothetical protein ACVWXO_001842 [Bradyrhizobium sp. LM2.7]
MRITIPKTALAKVRTIMRPCAGCGRELPIAEENKVYVYIEVWQGNGNSYCCEEHVQVH